MKKRALALVCASMMLLTACGNNGGNSKKVSDFEFDGYPMKNVEKMTYWVELPTNLSILVDNMGKTEFAKELKERTGVEVEYIHPAAGTAAQSLSLLMTSDEMPDMIESSWNSINGGAQKCIDDGVIIALNDYMEEYAPNLTKYLKEHPEIDKAIKTDDGIYYVFPFIRGEDKLLVAAGPVYRRDWAKELGFDEAPKTVDEIETLLKAYKKKGVKNPLTLHPSLIGQFMNNFGVTDGFYYKDGKVTYGALEKEYKTAVERLNKWYKEGLLDNNYVSNDAAAVKTQVLNGETAMTIAGGGGDLGVWISSMEAMGKPFDMVGFTNTSLAEVGEKYAVNPISNNYPGYGSVAITTSCKNPAAAVAYLDYGFGEEGHDFYNFGIEGVSYTVQEDGKRVYTDLIQKNPDGLSVATAMSYYFKASTSGPFVQDGDYIDGFYAKPNQQESLKNWIANMEYERKNILPTYSLTSEESDEFSSIMTEIYSVTPTERDKFITGKTSTDDYDKFIKHLKDLGIERAIEIVQTACDRYNKR